MAGRMNPTVVFVRPGQVALEQREVPRPGAGQVLIQTRCTLISTGTELTILAGRFPARSAWAAYGRFPFVPGYDNIGQVVDVGPGVEKSWIGRRVASYGPHARYVTAPSESVYAIEQEGIEDEHAAFFTIAEIVMNGLRRGRVQWGEAVVVYGLGLLGQLTVRFCRLCGAGPVFAVDLAEARLGRLPDERGIVPINPGREQVVSVVKEATRGRMADVVFEVTGDPESIAQQFEVLKPQGRLVVLSSPGGPTRSFDFHDLCNAPSFTIIGAHNSSHPQHETPENPWTKRRHVELFFELVAEGQLDLEGLISHREDYSEACRVYQMLLRDRSEAMGVILRWGR